MELRCLPTCSLMPLRIEVEDDVDNIPLREGVLWWLANAPLHLLLHQDFLTLAARHLHLLLAEELVHGVVRHYMRLQVLEISFGSVMLVGTAVAREEQQTPSESREEGTLIELAPVLEDIHVARGHVPHWNEHVRAHLR